MPPKTRYHDPIVQTEPPPADELPTIPGLYLERPGVYLHSDDVSVYLARLAERYHGDGRMALLGAAQAFVSASVEQAAPEDQPVVEEAPAQPQPYEQPVPADALSAVDRIEIYPNADGQWETRACDATGLILELGPKDFRREVAEMNARAKWPDKLVHELTDPTGDSVWNEQRSSSSQSVGVLSGRPRPSPRRLFLTNMERPESARPV